MRIISPKWYFHDIIWAISLALGQLSDRTSVTRWRHKMEIFTRYWPFVRGIHRCLATKASDAELWCFHWSAPEQTCWANSRDTSDLRRQGAHYHVTVMCEWNLENTIECNSILVIQIVCVTLMNFTFIFVIDLSAPGDNPKKYHISSYHTSYLHIHTELVLVEENFVWNISTRQWKKWTFDTGL